MKTICFTVPQRARSWNHVYQGIHWSKRKKLSDEWKLLVKMSLLKAKVQKTPISKPVDIEITAHMRRWIDPDNIYCKTIIDQLRDWGTLKDDSPEFVKSVKVSVLRDHDERIEVKIIY